MMRRKFSVHSGYACLGLENLGVLLVCHLVDRLGVHHVAISASITTSISAYISYVVLAISALPIETPTGALLLDCVDLRELSR